MISRKLEQLLRDTATISSSNGWKQPKAAIVTMYDDEEEAVEFYVNVRETDGVNETAHNTAK